MVKIDDSESWSFRIGKQNHAQSRLRLMKTNKAQRKRVNINRESIRMKNRKEQWNTIYIHCRHRAIICVIIFFSRIPSHLRTFWAGITTPSHVLCATDISIIFPFCVNIFESAINFYIYSVHICMWMERAREHSWARSIKRRVYPKAFTTSCIVQRKQLIAQKNVELAVKNREAIN